MAAQTMKPPDCARPPSLAKVPTELLQKIFRKYHAATYNPLAFQAGNGHSYSERFPAILLGSICSSWRDVAISTPDIWNKLPISISNQMLPNSENAQDAQLALITLCLQRTLGYPALHVHLTGMFSRADQTDTRALLAAMEHADRWVSLHIDVAEHLLSFLDGLRGRLSSLVSLTLDKSTKQAGASQIFVQAHALRTFTFDHRAPRFFLPFPQLTVLTVSSVYLPDLPVVLHQCQSLHTLNIVGNIEGPFPYRGGSKDSNHVVLPSLKRLVVNIEAKRTDLYLLARLFGMLTLPALRDIQIMQDQTSVNGKWAPFDEFLRMLRRSGGEDTSARSSLQQLALLNVSLPATDLATCLQEVPRLKDLWIDVRTDQTMTDALMDQLILGEREHLVFTLPRILSHPDEESGLSKTDSPEEEAVDDDAPTTSPPAQATHERREDLVPELERLHVSCPASFSAAAFMEMARSRTAPKRKAPPSVGGNTPPPPRPADPPSVPASPLRYINIHCTQPDLPVEPHIVARLRIMAAAGIGLFFRVGDRDVVHDGP